MLQITIPATELFDDAKQEFLYTDEKILQLEHSLVSLSRWESKHNKAFLSRTEKTHEETLDYIRCMTLTQNVNPDVYKFLTIANIQEVNRYISAPMTATKISDDSTQRKSSEIMTAEILYYQMITLGIPFECQKWHLNRLITLIRVCDIKNRPPKKMSRNQILSRNAALNAQRRKQWNTKG